MSPIKGIAAAVGLSLGATAVGLGTHFLSSSSDSTVEGKLRGERSRFLNFDYENDEVANEDEKNRGVGSYSIWLEIASKHASEDDTSKKFEDLNFEYDGDNLNGYNSKNQQSIKELKKRCKRLLSSEGNKRNLDLFKDYCIRPQHHG